MASQSAAAHRLGTTVYFIACYALTRRF